MLPYVLWSRNCCAHTHTPSAASDPANAIGSIRFSSAVLLQATSSIAGALHLELLLAHLRLCRSHRCRLQQACCLPSLSDAVHLSSAVVYPVACWAGPATETQKPIQTLNPKPKNQYKP